MKDHAKATHSEDGEGACWASVCPVRRKGNLLRWPEGLRDCPATGGVTLEWEEAEGPVFCHRSGV